MSIIGLLNSTIYIKSVFASDSIRPILDLNTETLNDGPITVSVNDEILYTEGIPVASGDIETPSTIKVNCKLIKAVVVIRVLSAICIQLIIMAAINCIYYIHRKNVIYHLCLDNSCEYNRYGPFIVTLFMLTVLSAFIMWCFQDNKYFIIPSILLFTFVFSTFIGITVIPFSSYAIFLSLISAFVTLCFVAIYAYTCAVDNYKIEFCSIFLIGALIGFVVVFMIGFIIDYNMYELVFSTIGSSIFSIYILSDLNVLYSRENYNLAGNTLIYVSDLYCDIIRIVMYPLMCCNLDVY